MIPKPTGKRIQQRRLGRCKRHFPQRVQHPIKVRGELSGRVEGFQDLFKPYPSLFGRAVPLFDVSHELRCDGHIHRLGRFLHRPTLGAG
jgi:hypothetical protein